MRDQIPRDPRAQQLEAFNNSDSFQLDKREAMSYSKQSKAVNYNILTEQLQSEASKDLDVKIAKFKALLKERLPAAPKRNNSVELIFEEDEEKIKQRLERMALEDFNYSEKNRCYEDIRGPIDFKILDLEAEKKMLKVLEDSLELINIKSKPS